MTVNAIYNYRTPFEVVIEKNWPGASFAIFNVNGLVSATEEADFVGVVANQRPQMTDIYNNPAQYLNGTAPLNVTGFVASLQHHWRRLHHKTQSR